jgi:exodeoxyribonuclease-3
MKIVSWNVNGVRAACGKGLLDWMAATKADVYCLQEVKATVGDVQHIVWPQGYEVFWNSAQKKGYSGTALFCRRPPLAVVNGIGSPEHDAEGRAVTAEFDDCYVIGVYVPNAQPELARITFRQAWDRALLAYAKKLEKKKPVVFCGDLNVAHEEIDLARPKENVGNPGFSDQERAGFRDFIGAGFVDTFREFEQGPGHYSWWTYRAGARANNVGWRIDYVMASAVLKPRFKRAWIEPTVMGSDHCPVGLELK